MPVWSFDRSPKITADVAIGRGPGMPSRLLLPLTDVGLDETTDLPPCPSLRGQPCRDYEDSFENAAASLTVPEQTPSASEQSPGTAPKTCAGGKTKKKGVKKKKKSKKRKKKRCGKKKKKKRKKKK
jgi:hypothetical protein